MVGCVCCGWLRPKRKKRKEKLHSTKAPLLYSSLLSFCIPTFLVGPPVTCCRLFITLSPRIDLLLRLYISIRLQSLGGLQEEEEAASRLFPDNTSLKERPSEAAWQPDPTAPVSTESLGDKSFELIAGRDVRPMWLSDLAAAEVFAAIQSPMNDEYQSEFKL